MKTAFLFAVATLASSSLLAASKPSVISEYAGNYQGTAILSGGGTVAPGTTTASFKASKKKENGSLSLTTTFNFSGSVVPIQHQLVFKKRALQYFLGSPFVSYPGSGTAKIKSRAITYTGSANIG